MLKVDVLQVFIKTSAIIGIGLFWFNFNEKVFKTVRRLAAAPLYWPKKEADYSSDSSDEEECDCSDDCRDEEEGDLSDDCSEARPQIPEPTFYIN